MKAELRLLAWELTQRCNLKCKHCRMDDQMEDKELSLEESLSLIDHLSPWANPTLILSGGEPLLREDLFEIIEHATSKNLRVVLATNGTLLNSEVAKKLKKSGVRRVSISLDFAQEEKQDEFRGEKGAFGKALEGINYLKENKLPFQINMTLTKENLVELPSLLRLAEEMGAQAFHVFFLVPTGIGRGLRGKELSQEEYEEAFDLLYEEMKKGAMEIKPTCAPHFVRILIQKGENLKSLGKGPFHTFSRGCLGGISFCFLSSRGEVKPCGYFELSCGSIREKGLREIWETSPIFSLLRDPNNLKGKCGRCEYRFVCGGCRARALSLKGDFLEEEPNCSYEPKVG